MKKKKQQKRIEFPYKIIRGTGEPPNVKVVEYIQKNTKETDGKNN